MFDVKVWYVESKWKSYFPWSPEVQTKKKSVERIAEMQSEKQDRQFVQRKVQMFTSLQRLC